VFARNERLVDDYSPCGRPADQECRDGGQRPGGRRQTSPN